MKKQLVTTLLAASALSASAASIHEGLLNYWALEADASDTASSFTESTGATSDNGSVNGTTSFATGLFGNAANLPGGAGNNITVLDGGGSTAGGVANDVDRTGSDLTISVWIKAAAWDTAWQGIVSHGEQNDYRIARRGNNNPALLAYAGGTGDIQTGTSYGATPAGDGLWHHIVATTANGGATQLYVDGVLEATGAGPASIAQSTANNNLLCIGCNPDNGREFNGLIDDLAMWDRVLTPSQIATIHSSGLAGTSLGAITIPEPSTALLGLLGALGLLRRRR
jgi:hypothetical protein